MCRLSEFPALSGHANKSFKISPVIIGQPGSGIKTLFSFNKPLLNGESLGRFSARRVPLNRSMQSGSRKVLLALPFFKINSILLLSSSKQMSEMLNGLFIKLQIEATKLSRHLRESNELKEIKVGNSVEQIDKDIMSKQQDKRKRNLMKKNSEDESF